MSERTSSRSESNRLGALIVGGLILTVLAVALLSSLVAKRHLDEAANAQVAITVAQQRLDDLLRAQLNEEASLREALATRKSGGDPYANMDDQFSPLIASLDAELRGAGLPQASVLTAEIVQTHRAWEQDVALPLRSGAPGANLDQLEAYGKILVDRFETQTLNLRAMTQARMKDVQAELSVKIDQTVEYSVAFVMIFALAGIFLTVRTSMARERFEREHSIVETFEDALRVGWDPLPQMMIGTSYLSATAEAQVGGDLIDIWRVDEERGFVLIADVSGKGLEAAVNTAFVKYAIRTLAADLDDPAAILERFNELFMRTIDDPQLFVDVFLGLFHTRTGQLSYASAGHGGAFLRRAGAVEILEPSGPIVGVERNARFERREIGLEPDDVLVLTTDGFTEARDQSGELLGDDSALALIASAPETPQALCDHLVDAVTARGGGRVTDDLALLAIAFAAAQASVRIG
ncbi:MAG TPA: PP2C family protein-serine/threonine phosphatase [Candidatus Binatia bacterium]|nr:PP2C family protein-serine/threonine phosphatase [Candidatus Binatia bacterium]